MQRLKCLPLNLSIFPFSSNILSMALKHTDHIIGSDSHSHDSNLIEAHRNARLDRAVPDASEARPVNQHPQAPAATLTIRQQVERASRLPHQSSCAAFSVPRDLGKRPKATSEAPTLSLKPPSANAGRPLQERFQSQFLSILCTLTHFPVLWPSAKAITFLKSCRRAALFGISIWISEPSAERVVTINSWYPYKCSGTQRSAGSKSPPCKLHSSSSLPFPSSVMERHVFL